MVRQAFSELDARIVAGETELGPGDILAPFAGGFGAVREVCELILKAQGRWEELMKRYVEEAPT